MYFSTEQLDPNQTKRVGYKTKREPDLCVDLIFSAVHSFLMKFIMGTFDTTAPVLNLDPDCRREPETAPARMFVVTNVHSLTACIFVPTACVF